MTMWDLRDAIVVCRQLGYTTAERRAISAEFGQGTGRIWRDNVGCSGSGNMLSSCSAKLAGEVTIATTVMMPVLCVQVTTAITVKIFGVVMCK